MNIIQIKGVEEMKIIDEPCVYFLTDSHGEILYIGKSRKSMIGRIAAHKYEKQFSRVFYIKCKGFNDMEETEAKLIKKINPRYNKIIPVGSETKGLLKDTEIKKITGGIDRRIINNAAKEFDIPMIAIGSRKYYDKKILEAIEKYINKKGKNFLCYRPKK